MLQGNLHRVPDKSVDLISVTNIIRGLLGGSPLRYEYNKDYVRSVLQDAAHPPRPYAVVQWRSEAHENIMSTLTALDGSASNWNCIARSIRIYA